MAKTPTKPPQAPAKAAAAAPPDPLVAAAAVAPAPAASPAPVATSVFDQAVGFVLREKIEGGYVNDPRDPGGETNFGISNRAYPRENIRALTREKAVAIYKRDYWDKPGCEDLPPKLAVALFDCAVNQGANVAPALLQRALGVKADGIIGPVTIKAAHDADQDDALIQFLGWRLRRYAFTGGSATYMRGWSNRVLELHRFALTDLTEAA